MSTAALTTTKPDAPAEQLPVVPMDMSAGAMVAAMGANDLSKLTDTDKLKYLAALSVSLKLNPLSMPFGIFSIKGKHTLYAKKDCTDQLRARDKVSITITERTRDGSLFIVRAKARMPDGREDESVGVVPVFEKMAGEDLANAMMKAETKAKRRVTLSICGLGFPDESELETINQDRRESGLTEIATAADRASALNAELAEPEPARPVEAYALPPEPEPVATPEPVTTTSWQTNDLRSPSKVASPIAHDSPATPEPVKEPAPASTPAPAPAPALDRPKSALTAEQVGKLEIILAPLFNDALAWLVANGKLKPGEPWELMDQTTALRALKYPESFCNLVKAWKQQQPKAA